MKSSVKIILVSTFFGVNLFFFSACSNSKLENKDSYVVMLSLDAFRWDYPELTSTPNLNAVAANGVRANALIPCFPSKTFPNHFSMATGLHPDHHGIVCNSFLDSTLGYYSIGNRSAVENPGFYGGEPIWVTAEKQGVVSASFFWVGSEAPIKGYHPTYWKKFDKKIPFEDRIDTVIHWLTLPIDKRPRLITWYSHEPDWTAHDNGATAPKTLAMASKLDSLIGIFMGKLSQLPHAKKINVLVVSDHGMADISSEKYINLSEYVDRDWFDVVTGGNPVYSLKPKAEKRQEALAKLKAIPNLKVWEKDSLPQRYVYGKNNRINDFVIEADLGYSVGWSFKSEPYFGGTHGYDNELPEMQGIFFAQGPAFAKGLKHPAFSNTNLYGIIAHILGIVPEPTDGNLNDVKGIFSKKYRVAN
jgi:alkaline phosphatase D